MSWKTRVLAIVAAAAAPAAPGALGEGPAEVGDYSAGTPAAVRPWTGKPINSSAESFQFAILADRTGGHRPGVFAQAIEKLNRLQPEFVMSIGDLIEGYTSKAETVARQWKEFAALADRLEMRFFHVCGNHDSGTEALDAAWRRRVGPRYYAFTYRGVLFVVLDSQDDRTDHVGLSAAQLAWARKTLAAHADARWTLVFLHQPLWTIDERAQARPGTHQPTGFAEMEKALAGRKYTVFAGHWHYYSKYVRHGRCYYQLATTGGQSPLLGVQYGSFDHVTWVTMTPAGPRVVNLLLDGIQPDDVFTEDHRRFMTTFARSLRVVQRRSHPFRLVVELSAENPFAAKADGAMTWTVPRGGGWTVTPPGARYECDPGQKVTRRFAAYYSGDPAGMIPVPVVEGTLGTKGTVPARGQIAVADAAVVRAVRESFAGTLCRQVSGAPACDGKLTEALWQGPPTVAAMYCRQLYRTCSVGTRAWLAHDRDSLYVAVRCAEPNPGKLQGRARQHDKAVWLDDSVEVLVDANLDRRTYHRFVLSAAGTAYESAGKDASWNGTWRRAAGREIGGWTAELAIPWQTLGLAAPPAGGKIGLLLARTRTLTREVMHWPPAAGGTHQPAAFAEVTLSGR